MSGRVVTFNTQMHADKQAGWLKRRKGSFLMMLAPIHCPKSPKSSKLKVWKATKLTKTGRSKSTKANQKQERQEHGEHEGKQPKPRRKNTCLMRWTFGECNKSPAKNERHVFICGSSVQRFRNRMIYNGITAAVKRLWHCFFITTTDVFSYLRVQNQIFSGLLNPDCSDEANDVPHLLTEKKTHWWFSAGDFFILGSKGGGDVWRLGI